MSTPPKQNNNMKDQEMKIEKGIPIPVKRKKYPFAEMEVGDSFFIEKKQSTVSVACSWFVREVKPEWGFTCRKENNGVRVWRYK